LPVELTSFTGYNDGQINVLDWITASEINTSKFEVEKSTDGYSFSYLGERPAAGNSTMPRTYQLVDNNPVIGNNYYRLKMIDIDGTYDYSDKILIKVADLQTNEGIVNIYPNPTKGEVNIVYQAAADHSAMLTIFNTIGQLMTDNSYQMKAGVNTITISATDYAKGLYIINLQNTDAGIKYQSKFVKE
ncbi:MAG TPA: T9SS type A sorting domain-containing protein, partial [Chitinophagales bacterium]|nr:T9SS type A sorting domain-containing protein [Chitinophagales bacterium]